MKISIFFPFLNDWATVGSLILSAIATVEPICEDYEVIVVDDGSNEQAKEMLRLLEKRFEKLKVITHGKNRGYGGALKTGFAESRLDWIFYTDCDAQYDVRELKSLIEKISDGVDVVQGYKIKRNDPWYRVVIGKLYHYTTAHLFDLKIRDVDCDFRLIRKSMIDKITLEENSGVICVELVRKLQVAGARFMEVPVHHYYRTSGKSQFFNFRRIFRVGKDLGKLWYRLVWQKRTDSTRSVAADS